MCAQNHSQEFEISCSRSALGGRGNNRFANMGMLSRFSSLQRAAGRPCDVHVCRQQPDRCTGVTNAWLRECREFELGVWGAQFMGGDIMIVVKRFVHSDERDITIIAQAGKAGEAGSSRVAVAGCHAQWQQRGARHGRRRSSGSCAWAAGAETGISSSLPPPTWDVPAAHCAIQA